MNVSPNVPDPVVTALLTAAAAGGDALAIDDGTQHLSWRDLAASIDAIARAAGAHGVAGRGVAVTARQAGAQIAALVGVRAAGGVPLATMASAVPMHHPALTVVAHAEQGARTTFRPAPPFSATDGPFAAPLPEGAAWLRPTGGSTSAGRLVAFTGAQTMDATLRSARMLELAPGERLLVTVPPTSGYGVIACWLAPLLSGVSVRLVPAISPGAVWKALSQSSPAWALTTPPVVRALARLPSGFDVAGRRLVSAAAPYPAEAAAELLRREGVVVLDRYGTTETGPVAQARVPGGPLFAGPGVTLRHAGTPATLEIACDGVGLGYVGEGEPFADVFRTADDVSFDEDGGFRISGRVDRVVRRAGRAVDLARIETALLALPGVALARVRAVAAALDVDLVAEVAPAAGAALEESAIRRGLAARLDAWETPTRVQVLDRAPAAPEKWRSPT
jgi:acyl-coenzyme A synthetase/AMP-(fatty) acid ligase